MEAQIKIRTWGGSPSWVWAEWRDPPVGQGHAVEQAGQSGVDAQAPGAERPEPVRLAPRPVHRVEVVPERAAASPPARRRVAVGWRHHEVSAVDHLGAGQGVCGGPGTGHPSGFPIRTLRVRVWRVLEPAPSSPSARHCTLWSGSSWLSVKQWTFSSLLLLLCCLQTVQHFLKRWSVVQEPHWGPPCLPPRQHSACGLLRKSYYHYVNVPRW